MPLARKEREVRDEKGFEILAKPLRLPGKGVCLTRDSSPEVLPDLLEV